MTDAPRPVSVDFAHGPLQVSANKRYLVHGDGTPFFYLADTAWELFHQLTREEIDLYMADRAAKRFTVAQVVALSELDGLTRPNAYGDVPLHDLDPARPNEAYFALVDYAFERARAHGLYLGFVPTWGSWVVKEDHPLLDDHQIFTPQNAETYGRFLGERYGRRPNVIWILGGDRLPEGYEEVWRAMARGIAVGVSGREDYAKAIMTFHPRGGHSSGESLQAEPWLTFGMVQSTHNRMSTPHEMVAAEYGRTPVKPVLNGEPGYERIPDRLDWRRPKLDEHDVRRFAYWSVFAGACGHTYGANEMWMMWSPEAEPLTPVVTPLLGAETPWQQALDYPGAGQMRHLRALMESRPPLTRVPDQGMVEFAEEDPLCHVQATRAADGAYAMVYLPQPGQQVTVRMEQAAHGPLTAWWFDPRTGSAERAGERLPARGDREFTSPSGGPDWVLVLDDASRRFPPPGVR